MNSIKQCFLSTTMIFKSNVMEKKKKKISSPLKTSDKKIKLTSFFRLHAPVVLTCGDGFQNFLKHEDSISTQVRIFIYKQGCNPLHQAELKSASIQCSKKFSLLFCNLIFKNSSPLYSSILVIHLLSTSLYSSTLYNKSIFSIKVIFKFKYLCFYV